MSKRWGLTALLGLLTACQGTAVPTGGPAAPTAGAGLSAASFTMDVAGFEQALASSPVTDWSSNTFASPRLLQARQARQARASGYRVAYAGWPAASDWTKTHVPSVISNATAYIATDPVNNMGPKPMPGDRFVYMTNAMRGTKSFFMVNPATGAFLNGSGWDVLTTVGAPAASRVDQSAVSVSTKGSQAMFVTTGGYFGAIDLSSGAKTAGFSLGQPTYRSAPFINNSAYPGLDGDLQVWCATSNAAGTVGQLHRLEFHGSWTYPGGALTVRGPAADGSAGTVTAAGFKASPVVWMGKVYIGDVAGRLWEYTIANGSARYWDMSPFSGVNGDQILAPAAFDLAADGSVDVFVACGARVFWIDPVTNAVVPSQQLLVDTATSTPGSKLQGPLAGYAFNANGGTYTLNATDTISVGARGTNSTTNGDGVGNEIVGSFHTSYIGDNKPWTGYLKFSIPTGAFGGKMPISADLTMYIDTYTVPNTSDAGSIYRTSIFLANASGADTTTVWTSSGAGGTRMNPNNQPRLLVPNPFAQRNGPCRPAGTPYNWNVNGAVPRDGTTYSFAMRGANKYYYGPQGNAAAAPGYYGYRMVDNRNRPRYRPNISVKLSTLGLNGAIMAQPVLLALSPNPKVYVANANALFELDYTNNGTFGNASETYFSLLASGRGGGNVGPVDISNKFIQNQVTTAISMSGGNFAGFVCDENGALGAPHLNKFTLPFNHAPNSDNLTNVLNLPAGSQRTTPYLTWDYLSGSLYFASQGVGSTLYRVAM